MSASATRGGHKKTSMGIKLLVHQWRTDPCRRMYHGTTGTEFTKFWNKCRLVRPLTLPIFVALRQKLCRMSAVENTHTYTPMPLVVPNFIVLGHTVYEKSVTENFYTRHYFGASGGPLWPKFTAISLPNFVTCWQPVYKISAAKLCWFRWKHGQQADKKSKRYVSA